MRRDYKILSYKLETGEKIKIDNEESRSIFEYSLLHNIHSDEIEEWAKENLDLVEKHECPVIQDYDADDLMEELESRGFDIDIKYRYETELFFGDPREDKIKTL